MKFRAIRNFLRAPGVDVLAGAIIEMDDHLEISNLVGMLAIEPADSATRRRVSIAPRVTWESAAEEPPRPRLLRVA